MRRRNRRNRWITRQLPFHLEFDLTQFEVDRDLGWRPYAQPAATPQAAPERAA